MCPVCSRGIKEARVPRVVRWGVEGDGGQSGQASARTWALFGRRWEDFGQFSTESDEQA